MAEIALRLLPLTFVGSRSPPGQAHVSTRNSEPRDLGCYERWASRRKTAHCPAGASAGRAFGELVGDRQLHLSWLSALGSVPGFPPHGATGSAVAIESNHET